MTVAGVAAGLPRYRLESPRRCSSHDDEEAGDARFDWLLDRRGAWLQVFGRLKPGVSQRAAAAGLQPWFKAMLDADMKHSSWPVVSAEERDRFLAFALDVLPGATGRSDLRQRLEQPLYVLLAAIGLVLLLACLNVANLSLARAFAERRDTALRLAIGASRARVARERLAESAILAGAGALVGTLLAPLVSLGLISFLPRPWICRRPSTRACSCSRSA
jgi:HAMP domain-containing protein